LNVQYGILGAWVSKSITREGSKYVQTKQPHIQSLHGQVRSSQVLWEWRPFRRRQRTTSTVGFLEVNQSGHILSSRIPRILSCASLLTTTATSRISLVVPVFLLSGFQVPSLSVVSQHRRSFVFKVLVKELSIRSIIIRWIYPFPWYNAWESYANASCAIEIAGCRSACKLFAEVGCEVVAVFREEVVGGALEFHGGLIALALPWDCAV
jgi:hypothetical protein